MNIRKHLAGFALFSVILGSAIFINYFLTLPNATIPPVTLRPLVAGTVGSSEPVNYKVQQVTLDFINATGYTALSLKLSPDQPTPKKLWVTTFYFSPDIDRSGWSSTTEISQPFAKDNHVEIIASEQWAWSKPARSPRISYFARVYVSTGYTEDSYPPDIRFERDLTDAIPVVVHWSNE